MNKRAKIALHVLLDEDLYRQFENEIEIDNQTKVEAVTELIAQYCAKRVILRGKAVGKNEKRNKTATA